MAPLSSVGREIHLNLFAFGCGHHSAAWRRAGSGVERLGDVTWWEDLARLCERGRLDALFLADGQSTGGAALAGGPRWFLEPITTLTALARATVHLGLVTTVSSSFWDPFHAARLLASLDHISGGRAGINAVTSMTDEEARNHGMDALPGHEERYARAEEFIRAMTALWDSFPADAVLPGPGGGAADGGDRAGDVYADVERIRPIGHRGRFFRVDGPLNIPAPPQGRPVLFQAGSSGPGRDLAARHAEGIYAVAWDVPMACEYRQDVRARAAALGRDPDSLVVMPGLVPYIGSTEAEARARKAELDALLPVEDSLRQLAFFVGQDTSGWDLDAPVPDLPPLSAFTGPQGRYATVLRILESQSPRPTVRELLGLLAAGGGHATMIGTPEQVAQRILEWVDAGAADGFNLMPPALPDDLSLFVEHVVPLLQESGRFRREYVGTTLRGRLAGGG